jgi:hypothetical protein
MKKLLVLVGLIAILSSCTEQQVKKQYGGTIEIKLPAGEKLMEATWKGEDLFYLTEPMEEGYEPKVKMFREHSSWGVMETNVKFIEVK